MKIKRNLSLFLVMASLILSFGSIGTQNVIPTSVTPGTELVDLGNGQIIEVGPDEVLETFSLSDLSGSQDAEYIYWQFTFFALIALDILGKKPDKPLVFLEDIKHEGKLQKWLDDRNWVNFWYAISNSNGNL